MNNVSNDEIEIVSWPSIATGYFGQVPAAHAMFRVAELKCLAGLRLASPVLEIGCGCGEFANAAIRSTIDSGVDISAASVKTARRLHKYSDLQCADARNLPFPDSSFATAISISVLEHIEDVQSAINEAHRVLQAGGLFIATVVLDDIRSGSGVARMLRRLRAKRLADAYLRQLDRFFRHTTVLGRDQWESMLKSAGFDSIETEVTVPLAVIGRWERGFLTAWPYRISPSIAKILSWRPRWAHTRSFNRLERAIERWQMDSGGVGGCLCIRARKRNESDVERT